MTKYPFETASIVHAPATLLEVRVYGVVRHVGLTTGYGTVIHASRRFGRVAETDFDTFTEGRAVRVIPYKRPLDPLEIVARARSKKGQRYNVLFNNCEHFITWVIEGKGRSGQLGPLDGRRFQKD